VSDLAVSVAGLGLHPVKSCAALAPAEVLVVETGFELDRAWMVVDAEGCMRTQRDFPRLALVRPTLRHDDLVLRAPGMLALHLALDRAEAPARSRVWDDDVDAFDMGDLAAQWFSDFLGAPSRVVRFDPAHVRRSDPRWTGDRDAPVQFADGFALLVASTASLDDLNRRLAANGAPPVARDRFRANLWLDGLAPWDEDHLSEIVFDADGGPVRLRLVKPCGRCEVPNVDPATGEPGVEPGRTLAGFRADARLDGAVTFGMNAIVLDGVDRVLRAGHRGRAAFAV
jgi:uncharacterized protein YcbX